MIARAHAKLNLALEVGARRADGFHDLVTIFQTLALADELEVEGDEGLRLEVEGDAPAGEENLVLRAARALAGAAGVAPRARVRLTKRIPAGGGLGGGSSDAAAALLALDRLWGTRAPLEDLHRLAAALGSDVPFFLLGGTALGLGRGERLFPIAELPARHALLALPGVAVSTARAYAAFDARPSPPLPSSARWRHARLWSWEEGAFEGLANDLEPCVFADHPPLARLKEAIAATGAEHALMSGSGSTVYGLYRDPGAARQGRAVVEASGVRAVMTETVGRERLLAERLA